MNVLRGPMKPAARTRPACQQCGGRRLVYRYDPDRDVTRLVRCPSCSDNDPAPQFKAAA